MKNNRATIIGLTTDPYIDIHGFALAFIRFFNYLQHTTPDINIILIANNGVCSTLVKNENFIIRKLNKKQNIIIKSFILIYTFIKVTVQLDKRSIVVSNCGLPELIATCLLKLKFKKTYCFIQDTRIRNKTLFCWLYTKLMVFFACRIHNIFFTNKFTMNQFDSSLNKIYIGNPVFLRL